MYVVLGKLAVGYWSLIKGRINLPPNEEGDLNGIAECAAWDPSSRQPHQDEVGPVGAMENIRLISFRQHCEAL